MEIFQTLVRKILDVIPLDQKTLGFILVGLGVLIIILVIVSLLAKQFKNKSGVNYQTKFEGARLSGPLTSVPPSKLSAYSSPNPNANFGNISPIRGNFAPKPGTSTLSSNEIGLSKLKSQVDFVPNETPAPASTVPTRTIIPNQISNQGLHNVQEPAVIPSAGTMA